MDGGSKTSRRVFLFFQILQFDIFPEISKNVTDKGNNQKDTIHKGNKIYGRRIQVWKEYQDNEADKQNGGTDLACNESARQHPSFLEENDTCGQLK